MKRWFEQLAEALGALLLPREVVVSSSAIDRVRYEPQRKALIVSFRNGERTYEYGSVPARTYRSFLRSDSKGRFFVREIRNRYPFRRLS